MSKNVLCVTDFRRNFQNHSIGLRSGEYGGKNNNLSLFLFDSKNDSNNLTDNIANDNNYLSSEEGFGFILDNSTKNTLNNNTSTENEQYGFILTGSENNTLEKNSAIMNGYGISLAESESNILTDNTINDNEREGFELGLSHHKTITGNTANDNGDNGIHLLWSNYNTVTENTLNNNDDGCIEEENCLGNEIDNNVCEEPNGDGGNGGGEEDGFSIPGYDILILLSIMVLTSAYLLSVRKKMVK